MQINKNTKIFGSFSKNAGNKGCEFFNNAFRKYNIDAIYKSFSVDSFRDAFTCAKVLKFSGIAIASPFKKIAIEYVDIRDITAKNSKSINTIVFDHENDICTGYNTDYIATQRLIEGYYDKYNKIYILGNGGLASAVIAQSNHIGFVCNVITRKNWDKIEGIKNSIIFNCTPIYINVDSSNVYIDAKIGTQTGDLFYKYQAEKQFELYTDIKI